MEVCKQNGQESSDEEVNWLECISAIETDQGLLYFCDAGYGRTTPKLSVISDFKINFAEGTHLYSITGYNPFNKVTNRIANELANHELLSDLQSLLPGCKIFRNFSYFPGRPYHFERGYTVQIPPDYSIRNHCMIIYSLSIKYQQAAFFKGVVLENGLTIPYVVLVQGEYKELKEELVSIHQVSIHPAFLHADNNVIFKDLSEALNILYQSQDQIPLCKEIYSIFKENYNTNSGNGARGRYPVISVEGALSEEMAVNLSRLLGADYCSNTPLCLKRLKEKVKHSTVLLAIFKTIADYIQASQISERMEQKSVVVHKYWSNTAASMIVNEIHKGQSNLPPKDHSVYQWPIGLLKPDAVVLLHGKGKDLVKTDKQKLKRSALKRMSDESWISVGIGSSRQRDVVPSLVVDKLHIHGLTNIQTVESMCPSSDMPSHASSATQINSDDCALQDNLRFTCIVDDNQNKPYW